jgi:hypothetical protein
MNRPKNAPRPFVRVLKLGELLELRHEMQQASAWMQLQLAKRRGPTAPAGRPVT